MAQVVTITNDGRQLIAQATSGQRIEFAGGGSSETNYTIDQMKSSTTSNFSDISGTIRSASATGTTARITLEISNKNITRQYQLKSFAIFARLSGSSAAPIVFAASSQESGAITLDTVDVVGNTIKFSIPFNIDNINNAQNIIIGTPGGYASLGDLNRFVSCHIAGNTQKGEEQREIRGYKQFFDGLTIYDNSGGENVISFSADDDDPDAPEDGISVSARMRFYSSKLTLQESELHIYNENITFSGQCNVGMITYPAENVYSKNIRLVDNNTEYLNIHKETTGTYSGYAIIQAQALRFEGQGVSFGGDVIFGGYSRFDNDIVGNVTFQDTISTAAITITTGDLNITQGGVYAKKIRVPYTPATASDTDISDGIYCYPQTVQRTSGAPILALNVGDFCFIKRNSYFINTIMSSHTNDNVVPGTTFKISSAMPNSGNGPYVAAVYGGGYVDASSGGTGSAKTFLGAGNYMILTGFWKSDTDRDMPILIKKIGTYA